MENPLVEPGRVNKRTARRYDVTLEFDYRLFGRDLSVQEGHGLTLNMSSSGLFVVPDQQIATGLTVEMIIQLPAEPNNPTRARLVILGRVLRSGPTGAAIKILRHGLIRAPLRSPA